MNANANVNANFIANDNGNVNANVNVNANFIANDNGNVLMTEIKIEKRLCLH